LSVPSSDKNYNKVELQPLASLNNQDHPASYTSFNTSQNQLSHMSSSLSTTSPHTVYQPHQSHAVPFLYSANHNSSSYTLPNDQSSLPSSLDPPPSYDTALAFRPVITRSRSNNSLYGLAANGNTAEQRAKIAEALRTESGNSLSGELPSKSDGTETKRPVWLQGGQYIKLTNNGAKASRGGSESTLLDKPDNPRI